MTAECFDVDQYMFQYSAPQRNLKSIYVYIYIYQSEDTYYYNIKEPAISCRFNNRVVFTHIAINVMKSSIYSVLLSVTLLIQSVYQELCVNLREGKIQGRARPVVPLPTFVIGSADILKIILGIIPKLMKHYLTELKIANSDKCTYVCFTFSIIIDTENRIHITNKRHIVVFFNGIDHHSRGKSQMTS